ncbi:MAG TPA: TlyA family RNA methyltransferase [Dehalococcoidia bacterium]|nr:TlyA family RNA methyltransferase [Dehalococcoidia bacterium]
MAHKIRLDSLLVARGLVESRTRAQALVMAGDVRVGGNPAVKPGMPVDEQAEVTIVKPPPFVGRGGIKLDHALSEFGISVSAKVAADIGASTGGFTDCLLKRGANRVYAVDVGYGQLDYRLRRDSRVVVMERVNARYPFSLPEKLDLAAIDVSFISVAKVIPSVAGLLKDGAYLVVLLKPQFEARKGEVGKGGVIKEPALQARVLGRFIHWLSGHGFRLSGLVASPILGASGNREFFVLLRQG